jgi:cell division ATPase FtsA
LLIFKDGMLKDIEILSFGGDDFTSELSDVIKIPFDLAEETKKSHAAIGDAGQVKDDKEILLKKDRIYRPIKQKVILEITTAKAKSICGDIKGALDQKVNYSEVNNFTVTGRTVLIDGFLEALEATLGLPVTLGRITDASLAGFLDKIDSSRREKYLNYITSLGLVSEALNAARPKILPTVAPAKNIFLRTINRFKEVYQEYF